MKLLKISAIAVTLAAVPLAAQTGDNWEGLVKVKSQRADAAYLLPGVDFRTYTKVMFDPTEVAFRRNWQRDYNRSAMGGRRLDDREVAEIVAAARSGFEQIFTDAYREAGWQVVSQAGPDVLRLRTGVVNLYIVAPEQMTAGRTRTYSAEAGEATLVIEARDSLTGALLGRAIDVRTVGDLGGIRTQVSNRADFELVFRQWARASVRGLDALKAESPIDPNAPRTKR